MPRMVLVDGNSLLYRAYFAIPPLSTAEGQPTNAVYGFTTMLLKLLEEDRAAGIAVAFDTDRHTFRHQDYSEYKANRPRTPDDLRSQVPLVMEVLEALQIPALMQQGYEADDIIGTLAVKAAEEGYEVRIVTGDQDALQLVNDHVTASIVTRGVSEYADYDRTAVEKRFGFGPERLNEYRALKGDPSDNIPGVPGVGEKTAADLIRRFGTLEGVYEHLNEVPGEKLRQRLAENREQAEMSRRLSVIETGVPLPEGPRGLGPAGCEVERVISVFQRLGFKSLAERVVRSGICGANAAPGTAVPETMTLLGLEEAGEAAVISLPRVGIITGAAEMKTLLEQAMAGPAIAVSAAIGEGGAMRGALLGIALAGAEFDPCFIPLVGTMTGMKPSEAIESLRPLLEEKSILKYGHDLKEKAVILRRYGIRLSPLTFDAAVASYLLQSSRPNHNLDGLLFDQLGIMLPEVGKVPVGDDDSGTWEKTVVRSITEAVAILDLVEVQERKLREMGLDELFSAMEMPLIDVLAEMEMNGIALDVHCLEKLSSELETGIDDLQKRIYEMAGEEFNIGSPRQLQHVFFEKLGLPAGKKTKTGYSTDVHVLEALSDRPVVAAVLEYRELTKLKSTYVDAMPRMINPETGRLHTTFHNTVTATGRLSSSSPNLQNIPVRTPWGKKMRRAFVAPPGYMLLKADYSQIELRVLAHLSGDDGLIEAFNAGEDIHTHTAADIFGVTHEEVTSDMRRVAKTVNFGLLYGMGEQRLGRDLGIPVREAKGLITRYFERFPSVKGYMQSIVSEARDKGCVRTLLGRMREMGDIRSPNPMLRSAAERAAANTPIQGTAADIMKAAMNSVYQAMGAGHYASRLLLQIHDELLFEVVPQETTRLAALVKSSMEEVVRLSVPLVAELQTGENWQDMSPLTLG